MRKVRKTKLWIGNAVEARRIQSVLDLGVAAVIDLAMEELPISYPRDLVYCRFPLIDGAANDPVVLRAAVATTACLLGSEVPTLVACGAGMSRSLAVAAAALARVEGPSMDECLEEIAAAGPHDVSMPLWGEVKRLFE